MATASMASSISDTGWNHQAASHSLLLELKGTEPEAILPQLLDYSAQLHVSDVFFNSEEGGVDVAVRHLGLVRQLCNLPVELGRRCISYVKMVSDMNISEKRRPMDGRWLYKGKAGQRLDLRVNTLPTLHGEDCTIRILDQGYRILDIEQLGMEPEMQEQLLHLIRSPSGLLLVTGPTESGKSTTLYACLNHLNNSERKISTIEDPIEYSIKGIRQSQVNTSLGVNFDELLRHVLRQSPDVIMIGEIRDTETARIATRAGSSGHFVLSTLHAPVAVAAIHSLLRLDVNPHLLATSLRGVISQRLLRTLCPKCKLRTPLPKPDFFAEIKDRLKPGDGEFLYMARGCADCHMTGYSGRVGVFEMLTISQGMRDLVEERAPATALRNKAVEEGMIEFRKAVLLKVARGDTSLKEVYRRLPPEYLQQES